LFQQTSNEQLWPTVAGWTASAQEMLAVRPSGKSIRQKELRRITVFSPGE
jgi:hypothetical protein